MDVSDRVTLDDIRSGTGIQVIVVMESLRDQSVTSNLSNHIIVSWALSLCPPLTLLILCS